MITITHVLLFLVGAVVMHVALRFLQPIIERLEQQDNARREARLKKLYEAKREQLLAEIRELDSAYGRERNVYQYGNNVSGVVVEGNIAGGRISDVDLFINANKEREKNGRQ